MAFGPGRIPGLRAHRHLAGDLAAGLDVDAGVTDSARGAPVGLDAELAAHRERALEGAGDVGPLDLGAALEAV